MMDSILSALAGGVMVGLSASALMWTSGRVAGISGIVGGMLSSPKEDHSWRLAFVVGLLAAGILLSAWMPHAIAAPNERSLTTIAVAGLLVGFGTRLGNGCTSGHGVCGLSRFSRRSLVATLAFMATGGVTATLIGWITS